MVTDLDTHTQTDKVLYIVTSLRMHACAEGICSQHTYAHNDKVMRLWLTHACSIAPIIADIQHRGNRIVTLLLLYVKDQ